MAWELHSGKSVYYRSHRKGKKVTREYYGTGDMARLASALDSAKRSKKQPASDLVVVIRKRWEEASKPLKQLSDGTRLLMTAVRLTTGCGPIQEGGAMVSKSSEDAIRELRDLVGRAEAGDASVLPQIRGLLDAHPHVADHFGDVAKVAVELWISVYAGSNPLVADATRGKMLVWRASIIGPNPSPLESLMIELIMVCWLQVHYAEAMYAQAIEAKASRPVLAEKALQQETASQRFAVSLKQLVEIRTLLPEATSGPVKLHTPPQ